MISRFLTIILLTLSYACNEGNNATLSVLEPEHHLTVEQLESRWKRLYRKGTDSFNSNDYVSAERFLKESIDLLASNDATNSSFHVYALIKLGETYYASGNKKKQAQIHSDILNIGNNLRPGSKRHVDYLYHLGIYYSNTERYKEAINALEQALSHKEALAQMPGEKARVYHREALCYYCMGKLKEAISFAEKSVASDDNQLPDYIKSLAYYYFKASEWEKLESLMPNCFDYSREAVLRKFTQSKSNERAFYWGNAGVFFTKYLPYYSLCHPSDVLSSYAYDAALFGKGVLLAAENKSSELTLDSDNPDLLKLYDRYLELKRTKHRNVNEEVEMQSLSDVMIRYQKEHKNEYRKDFRLRWTDVRNRLSDGEVAIEFMAVPGNNGVDEYFALSLKSGYDAPKLTRLARFDEMAAIPADCIYTTSALFDLVWGPLEDEICDAKKIYFSPAGMFYSTGIEYLPNEDNLNLSATKSIYRLSSTKEIVLSKPGTFESAVLFGGIDYTPGSNANGKSPSDNETIHRSIPLESLNLRSASSGFSYLPGTMEEVGDIALLLLDSDIPANVFAGGDGSEAHFKGLSGTEANILHIATHGFYYSDRSFGHTVSIDKLFLDLGLHFTSEDLDIIDEDKMLTRSGLALAGANSVFQKETAQESAEDGILYADEISGLNLSSVDLLVLSACQSGLGDIASSEGVFGLQRGFKLAGVRSIMMSLWKVDDEATRILMSEFYKNLLAGVGAQAAMANAQLAIRTYKGGIYDDPTYWAAFVLLDAFDGK